MMTDESKLELYRRQKQLLDTFLEHGAISKDQYDKSLGDLKEKMGIESQKCKCYSDSYWWKIQLGGFENGKERR